MRTGCVTDFPGANVPVPAEDVLNENLSHDALGRKWKQTSAWAPELTQGLDLFEGAGELPSSWPPAYVEGGPEQHLLTPP